MKEIKTFTAKEINDFKHCKEYFSVFPFSTLLFLTIIGISVIVALVLPFTKDAIWSILDAIGFSVLFSTMGFLKFLVDYKAIQRSKQVTPEQLISYTGILEKNTFRRRGEDRKVKLLTADGEILLCGIYEYYQLYLHKRVQIFADNENIYIIRML